MNFKSALFGMFPQLQKNKQDFQLSIKKVLNILGLHF